MGKLRWLYRLGRLALIEKWQLAWIAATMAVFLAACEQQTPTTDDTAAQPPTSRTYQGTIVAVGDSLTSGLGVPEQDAYPAQLERKLQTDGYAFEVINAGVSGETSAGTLARMEWVITSLRPDIVILETGANDGLRGLSPDGLERNLQGLVSMLKANGIDIVLAGMLMLPNLGPEYTEAFATIYPRVARNHDVELIPFFLEGVAGNPRYNQADRLHPTAEGYSVIVGHIYPHVVAAVDKYLGRKHKTN